MVKKDKKTFDVLIEIPKGSRNKYEYDFDLHKIRFDRMLFSSMMYPGDYGFIPETLALDGDPLDVLVLGHEPTFPMCVMEVKPIGVFHMADEKGPDEKIICVSISDPIWSNKNDIYLANDTYQIGNVLGGSWDQETGILEMSHSQNVTSLWQTSWNSRYVRQ